MKEAQALADQLETSADHSLVTVDQVRTRKNLFKLWQQDIQSASVGRMMDEECLN